MIPTPDPVVTGLAKDSDMGSKPILESTADVRKPAIVDTFEEKLLNLSFAPGKRVLIVFPPAPVKRPPPPPNMYGAK